MKLMNLLFGIKPPQTTETIPQPSSNGVLFGKDPPNGTYFDVVFNPGHPKWSTYEGWFVYIKDISTDKELAYGCSAAYYSSDSAKTEIPKARDHALASYYDKQRRKDDMKYVGQYPPKSTA